MIHDPSESLRVPYSRPFQGTLEAGFGSVIEMECLCGLVRHHIETNEVGYSGGPRLFEIGTHRGAGVCHFYAMVPELEIHSLNVQRRHLIRLPRQMASEILPDDEIGMYARDRNIPYTQHLANPRTFDWEGLAARQRFDIVFIDGCHDRFTVLADTLNALKIIKPGGLIIWHDFKVTDSAGRDVFAAVNDLDANEFGGNIHHVEGTWLAWAIWPLVVASPGETKVKESPLGSTPVAVPLVSESKAVALHLASERQVSFSSKVRSLPENPLVLFFSDHRNPVWPGDDQLIGDGKFVATRDPSLLRRANVVVFHLPQVPLWHRFLKLDHQIWVGVTMESDEYYPSQKDPGHLATLDFLISYHAEADICASYSYPGTWEQVMEPPLTKDPEKLVCALISNSHSLSGRERLIERIESILPVHHFGAWRLNQPSRCPPGREAKLQVLRNYQFCLAFENCVQEDYVTEKWFDCFAAGCVPVYWGAPNIAKYAPGDGAYLDVRSINSTKALAEILLKAGQDRDAYARFFEWKKDPAGDFRKLYLGEHCRRSLFSIVEHAIVQKLESKV